MRGAPEIPEIPADVAVAFAAFPDPVRVQLLEVRRLIFATAAETSGVGPLTETLKWGEPAYLTEATVSGSTIRLGPLKSPGHGRGAVGEGERSRLGYPHPRASSGPWRSASRLTRSDGAHASGFATGSSPPRPWV